MLLASRWLCADPGRLSACARPRACWAAMAAARRVLALARRQDARQDGAGVPEQVGQVRTIRSFGKRSLEFPPRSVSTTSAGRRPARRTACRNLRRMGCCPERLSRSRALPEPSAPRSAVIVRAATPNCLPGSSPAAGDWHPSAVSLQPRCCPRLTSAGPWRGWRIDIAENDRQAVLAAADDDDLGIWRLCELKRGFDSAPANIGVGDALAHDLLKRADTFASIRLRSDSFFSRSTRNAYSCTR